MNTDAIEAMLDNIEAEVGDIYQKAEEGIGITDDSDPCVSEVLNILHEANNHFGEISDWVCNISTEVEGIRGQLENIESVNICEKCGNRA